MVHFVCKFVELSYFQQINLEVAPIQSSIWWKGWCDYFPFDNWFSCTFWPCFVDFGEVFLPLTLPENCCFFMQWFSPTPYKIVSATNIFQAQGGSVLVNKYQHLTTHTQLFQYFPLEVIAKFCFSKASLLRISANTLINIPWTHHWWATKKNAFWYS